MYWENYLRHPVLEELSKIPSTGEFLWDTLTGGILWDTLYWKISMRQTDRGNSLRHPVLEELFKTPSTGGISLRHSDRANSLRHPVLRELFKTFWDTLRGGILWEFFFDSTLYRRNYLRHPILKIFLRHTDRGNSFRHPVLRELFKTLCTGKII